MTALLGIDLGTSAVKVVVIDEAGALLGVGMHEIPMEMPQPGYAEQDPDVWWSTTVVAAREALDSAGVNDVSAIGLDGHMHGVLLLDDQREPIGRAITWADQRAAALVPQVETKVGIDTFLSISGTRPAAGFMAPTLVWLAENDPGSLEATTVCLLPKDYLRMRLCGDVASDVSDASATALFDIGERTWSTALCQQLGIPMSILPDLHESAEVAGTLGAAAASELGLRSGIPVVAGSADQPAQAVANGLLEPGTGSITLGTGGQVLCATDRPVSDPLGRTSTFCHAAPEHWYQLGATLAAGLSLRWLRDTLLPDSDDPYAQFDRLAEPVEPGAEGLTFLPYLVGERSPIMDPNATGAFVGLTLRHGRGHLARAVLEGVACSLRATRDAIRDAGGECDSWLATGNGLASPLWRGIVADVMAEPLSFIDAPERTGVGAALIAGIGVGVYSGYGEAASAARPPLLATEPDSANKARYQELYEHFQERSELLLAERPATS